MADRTQPPARVAVLMLLISLALLALPAIPLVPGKKYLVLLGALVACIALTTLLLVAIDRLRGRR